MNLKPSLPSIRVLWRTFKLSQKLSLLCGLLVVLLGGAVIAGWLTGQEEVIQVCTNYIPMQFLTALCFILSGVSLVGHGLGHRLIAMVLGGLVGAVGGLLCVEYFFQVSLGFGSLVELFPTTALHQAIKPAPPTSLSFVLCGTALTVLGITRLRAFHRRMVWVVGALVLTLSTMAIVGYASGLAGTHVWGRFTGMAIHTAGGLGILSVGLLCFTVRAQGSTPSQDDPWFPVPVAIAGVTATLMMWHALEVDFRGSITGKANLMVKNLATGVTGQLNSRFDALDRMARRWEFHGGTPLAEWTSDADNYLSDGHVVSALEWISEDGKERWTRPTARFSLSEDLRGEAAESLQATIDLARSSAQQAVSPVLRVADGRQVVLICIPLLSQGRPNGHLVGGVDLQPFLEEVCSRFLGDDYAVSISENGQTFFSRGGDTREESIQVETDWEASKQRWSFTLIPQPEMFAEQSGLPRLVLILGLGVTALVGALIHVMRKSRHRSQALALAHATLQSESKERLAAQNLLRESEKQLQNVLDTATGVSVIACDSEGIITFFNKGAEQLLGYAAEEMVGKMSPSCFHDLEEVKARGEELSAELGFPVTGFEVFVAIPKLKGIERREWTYVCKDGSLRTVELTVTVASNLADQRTAYLGTAIDITSRKLIEAQLQDLVRTEQNSRALLDAAARIAKLGYWGLRLDGSGPQWSDSTYEIHEVKAGTPVSLEQAISFYDPEDRPLVEQSVKRAIHEGVGFEFEARMITARNRSIWVHSRGEPVTDDAGKVVSMRGVVQDVTERKQAAELLARHNKELKEATAQAQATSMAKAEFLANMSHEIRTPLNAIIGISELLNDESMSPRQIEYVNTIRASGDALLGIINDILDFSKIEAGQLELEHIPLDVRECVESSLDLVAAQASKKKLDLLYWIDASVPAFVLGDPTRIRQILVNLLTNAVKFTESGEVVVRVKATQDSDKGGRLHISVRDTGIGIPLESQHRLFQSFSQVDSSTSRRYGGTGLGLAICDRLVSIMEGRIWVESNPGEGANFQFEVPLCEAEVPQALVYEASKAPGLNGTRILIVDDNATNCWILEAQTRMWGIMSRSTTLPQEALAWVQRGDHFDIAILDGHMPGMSGFELAEKMASLENRPSFPIIILTSMGAGTGRDEKAGVSCVLSKPIKMVALQEALRKLLLVCPQGSVRSNRVGAHANWAVKYPLKILVAEDNPVNQRVIALQLEKLGYRMEIVSNGLEVLAALHRKRFDLILMDVQMPEMDGLQASVEIHRLYPESAWPRIVGLTANAVSGDREACMAAGFDDYLTKPLRSDALADALRNAFQALRAKAGVEALEVII